METLIKDINILSEKPGFDDFNDIIIKDGIITEIGKNLSSSKAIKINGEGLTCTPGFYDMHVHFRDPGQIHKEDIFSGTMAAASGGFTGVLCMPNTNPPVDNAMIVNYIRKKSRDLIVDIDICGCISKSREGNELAPILSLSKAGAIAFTDDGSPVSNPELLRRAFEYTAQINSIVIQHCEDMNLTNNGHINEGFYSSVTGLRGIPEISETSVIARDSLICSYVSGARYHVQHISCGKSVDIISGAKESGINLSCEVCPHHFILTDENCINYDTNFKMNPPLRTASDVQRILNGIKNDIVDVICTDHAPHTEYEKSQGFYDAPFGIIVLETAIGLSYTYLVKENIISLSKLVEKMSLNPRKILNLKPICIKPGEKANLTFLDLNKKWTVNNETFKSKSRNSPFIGYELYCKPVGIFNNDKLFFNGVYY